MFIAMELVRGRDFEAYLREIERHGGRIGVPKLVELLGPIVDTLEAAHAWVNKALAIKPDDRFQTPRELWSAFLAVMRVELGR